MADETILEKAVALIPGVGSSKSKKLTAAQRHKQLLAIQKKLQTLAKDIESLADHVAEEVKSALPGKKSGGTAARKPATAKKPPAAKKAAPAKKPASKTAAKPAAAPKKKPAASRKTAKTG